MWSGEEQPMDESEGSFHDASKIMEGDASDPHPGDVDNLQNANSGISGGSQSKQFLHDLLSRLGVLT
jgi:hypothetical protein